MTLLQAIFLGIVQGLTEFLPISSSAHLRLAKYLLGISDGEHLLFFDLVCHGGTLLALVFFLRKEIIEVFKNRFLFLLFTAALIPLVPVYFLLKPLRIAMSDPSYLGYFLWASSLFLFAASFKKEVSYEVLPRKKLRDVVCIGMVQTMALLPGISRSGSTIATARLLGWDWLSAAKFSFLLSVPAILGGQILETIKLLTQSSSKEVLLSKGCYIGGFGTSFALGLIGVRAIFWIYQKGQIQPFAWYCLGAGFWAWWIFHG